MRLAYLTEWFPPEPDGAPIWIAQALRDEGFDVGVFTGIPHYPSGEPADGYAWHTRRHETIEGFSVLRLPEYPSHDRLAIRRMATYASFAASSTALGSRAIGMADACLVYSSPATSALAAMVARRRYGTPYVLLIQDLWPDSVLMSGFVKDGPARRALIAVAHRFVDATYRYASHIVVISPGMRTTLVERGVPEDKVSVVWNWVDDRVLGPRASSGELRRRAGVSDTDFVLLFAGNLGEAQGLGAWIEAIRLLGDRPEVNLVLMGDGTQKLALMEQALRLGVANRVHTLPQVPIDKVSVLTADADACLVSLKDDPLFRITLPSKLQAVLAQAKPVICSVPGDGAAVVQAAGAGWVALPDDPRSMAEAVRQSVASGAEERARRGRSGRSYYIRHMSREVGSTRLASVLRDVARRR